jgi:hypothetical protein
MAVVDRFEAMTATQFYREPRKPDDAVFEIEKLAGKRYDPKVVEAFKKALPAMLKVRESLSDALGDLINLDFAPKAHAASPSAVEPTAAPLAAAKPAAAKPPPPRKPALDVAALAKAAAAKAKK